MTATADPSAAQGHRAALEDIARRTVDDLVRQGMPRPASCDLVIDGDVVALSLTLDTPRQLLAWGAVVDSTDLEPTGPHRIGPVSTVALTGRLVGIPAVLHAVVDHDHPTDRERAEARALLDDPVTADHDTAGWRAAIDAADADARAATAMETP